jgi:two-component system, OmpR family, sensor histidine kinase ArlS
MKLREKIILLFSGSFLLVLGIALLAVYFSMAEYREQEFLQRLKERTTTTLRLLLDVQKIDHDLLRVLDETTINNFYDEKILLFDSAHSVIYSSVDDTAIHFPLEIIKSLKDGEDEIFYREDGYDVYAHSIIHNNKKYYAIGKAYDRYGTEKMQFLVATLIGVFLFALVIQILLALYLSRQITKPIALLTQEVKNKSIANLSQVSVPHTQDEIALLASGFNTMLERVEQSYTYQKNLIHHISHELKTPIAVLISNIERVSAEKDIVKWQESLEFQKNGLMQMSAVISTLLDISKYESNTEQLSAQTVRIDELLFSIFESLQVVAREATFELAVNENIKDTEELTCIGNERMLNIAFLNILKNAISYSTDQRVSVELLRVEKMLEIRVVNNGDTLGPVDQQNLFSYFFRGSNSNKKIGIGLGLVMVSKIIQLHKGTISYSIEGGKNQFAIQLPRS